ncbi:hypothetical protein Tco_1191771 [Tanacetum coccineum]
MQSGPGQQYQWTFRANTVQVMLEQNLWGVGLAYILAKVKDLSVILELLKHMSSDGFDDGWFLRYVGGRWTGGTDIGIMAFQRIIRSWVVGGKQRDFGYDSFSGVMWFFLDWLYLDPLTSDENRFLKNDEAIETANGNNTVVPISRNYFVDR